jgi:flavin reductase (DIM6/NTAB) family NADH-FMN oxidoreductase RutF
LDCRRSGILLSITSTLASPENITMTASTATKTDWPQEQFRDAMSHAVTGVNIVTTDGALGRYGLTVSAVSSVSTEPPMILVCVNRKSIA